MRARVRYRIVVLLLVVGLLVYSFPVVLQLVNPKWFPSYPYYISKNPLMKMDAEPPWAKNFRLDSKPRANATLMSLVRNEELKDLLTTMADVERTFNSKFNYPWTFINDKKFTEEFKQKTSQATNATVYYEIIPNEHWTQPDWIDPYLEELSSQRLEREGVQYSRMGSYHRMCRWNSGLFYMHPRMQQFRWYWRVEPKTHYFCDIDYDVFRFMEDAGKVYGFVINLYDSPQSIRTLWSATMEFVSSHPDYVNPNSARGWLTQNTRPDHNDVAGYSTCHFWSNFEIGDMDFWRSNVYQEYFEHLDRAGGFFYERWGDAPVHSIALGLFADKDKIHWFKDIGYQHIPYFNCPNSPKCSGCIPGLFSDGAGLSPENCFPQWVKYGGITDF